MKTLSKLLSLISIFLVLTASGQYQNRAVTIYDIQYTEDPYGDSPYLNNTVTVTGIVTASAHVYDLGFVFIQDEGGGPWSGIWLSGAESANLYRGEEVTVTGKVEEISSITRINTSSVELTGQLKEIVVSDLDPSDSTSFIVNGWEKWESVLVQYKDPDGNKLYISHPKPDGNNDFGDYAVSPVSRLDTKKLGRILAGRITSSLFSSLYVSIVSDLAWFDNSGQMEVEPIAATTSMEMDGIIGIMAYNFGDYRLLPRNNDDFVNINIELEPTNLPGSPLGINEHKETFLSLYPNPASDIVTISSDAESMAELKLFDIDGKQILQKSLKADQYILNVSMLKAGLYFIHVKDEKNRISSKQLLIMR